MSQDRHCHRTRRGRRTKDVVGQGRSQDEGGCRTRKIVGQGRSQDEVGRRTKDVAGQTLPMAIVRALHIIFNSMRQNWMPLSWSALTLRSETIRNRLNDSNLYFLLPLLIPKESPFILNFPCDVVTHLSNITLQTYTPSARFMIPTKLLQQYDAIPIHTITPGDTWAS